MTINKEELRRLAEAAPESLDDDYLGILNGRLHREIKPSTILALLDELEAASLNSDRAYRNGLKAGYSFGCSADEDGFQRLFSAYQGQIHSAMQEQKP